MILLDKYLHEFLKNSVDSLVLLTKISTFPVAKTDDRGILQEFVSEKKLSWSTDYGLPMKPFFIEIQNFWAWADKFDR